MRAFNVAGPQHGHIELRVGIATGQVVAGVVGTKRFVSKKLSFLSLSSSRCIESDTCCLCLVV